MTDLVEFMKARLDEDKQAAHRAREWWDSDREAGYFDWPSREASAHVQRHNPARVLAEVEAQRRILRDYEQDVEFSSMNLRYLAAVYAAHPDYREEWRPA